jgi:hypothetical protein
MKNLIYLLIPLLVSCSGKTEDISVESQKSKESTQEINSDNKMEAIQPIQEEVFKCSFLEADRVTPLTNLSTDIAFYAKITYPKGFERTTFNLHEMALIDNSGHTFQSLVIPYSEFEELKDGLLIKMNVPRDEDYELNEESFATVFDSENGKMKIRAILQSSNEYLICQSDTIVFEL